MTNPALTMLNADLDLTHEAREEAAIDALKEVMRSNSEWCNEVFALRAEAERILEDIDSDNEVEALAARLSLSMMANPNMVLLPDGNWAERNPPLSDDAIEALSVPTIDSLLGLPGDTIETAAGDVLRDRERFDAENVPERFDGGPI